MVKDQNSNPIFQSNTIYIELCRFQFGVHSDIIILPTVFLDNDSKFHEPTSPANAQSELSIFNHYLLLAVMLFRFLQVDYKDRTSTFPSLDMGSFPICFQW